MSTIRLSNLRLSALLHPADEASATERRQIVAAVGLGLAGGSAILATAIAIFGMLISFFGAAE